MRLAFENMGKEDPRVLVEHHGVRAYDVAPLEDVLDLREPKKAMEERRKVNEGRAAELKRKLANFKEEMAQRVQEHLEREARREKEDDEFRARIQAQVNERLEEIKVQTKERENESKEKRRRQVQDHLRGEEESLRGEEAFNEQIMDEITERLKKIDLQRRAKDSEFRDTIRIKLENSNS